MVILEVSLDNRTFLVAFSYLRIKLEGGIRQWFLCKDLVHLETVNITGAKCITGMNPTVANIALTEPVPQFILTDFVREIRTCVG